MMSGNKSIWLYFLVKPPMISVKYEVGLVSAEKGTLYNTSIFVYNLYNTSAEQE